MDFMHDAVVWVAGGAGGVWSHRLFCCWDGSVDHYHTNDLPSDRLELGYF